MGPGAEWLQCVWYGGTETQSITIWTKWMCWVSQTELHLYLSIPERGYYVNRLHFYHILHQRGQDLLKHPVLRRRLKASASTAGLIADK